MDQGAEGYRGHKHSTEETRTAPQTPQARHFSRIYEGSSTGPYNFERARSRIYASVLAKALAHCLPGWVRGGHVFALDLTMVQTAQSHPVAAPVDVRSSMSPSNPRSPRRRPPRARAAKQLRSPARDADPTAGPEDGVDPEGALDPVLDAEDFLTEADAVEPDGPAWGSRSAAEQEALRESVQTRLSAYLKRGRARVVLTDNLYSMVTIKRGDGVLTFRIHHMFADAPASVLRAMARYAESQSRDSASMLRAYIDANDDRVRRRESPRPMTVDVQGKHHNLQALFDELNAAYFDGGIKARITWGPRTKRKRSRDSIKLGSYTVEDALIRIHPVLDAADVPRFFVEWVVYHEMLHEIHDMPIVDGRRVYHTAEFRRAEAQFDRYAEAVMWERTHLEKLLDR